MSIYDVGVYPWESGKAMCGGGTPWGVKSVA